MAEERTKLTTRWGKVPGWWLTHPDVDADRFCILAALSTYADANGVCFPSQATLATRLKRSRPWVNKVIAELAEAGLLLKKTRTRSNGGNTSCEYELSMDCPTEVLVVTAPVAAVDSPRHPRDGNQRFPEQTQIKPTPERPHGKTTPHAVALPLRSDWFPGTEALSEAKRLCPDADLEAHAAKFALRCRAKGYLIVPGREDDTWMAWLVEDERGSKWNAPVRRRHDKADAGRDRFAAWGTSASAPPIRFSTVEGGSPWN